MGDWLRLYRSCCSTGATSQSIATFNQILCNHKQFKHLERRIKPFSSYFNRFRTSYKQTINRKALPGANGSRSTRLPLSLNWTTTGRPRWFRVTATSRPTTTTTTTSSSSRSPPAATSFSYADDSNLIIKNVLALDDSTCYPATAAIASIGYPSDEDGLIKGGDYADGNVGIGLTLNPIKKMGLMQSKNQPVSRINGCACTCGIIEHKICCGGTPTSLPYRTTVFSGNPYYSKGSNGKRWFSIDSTKMTDKQVKGIELLKDNRLNKDLSFTMRERDQYKIRGLVPAAIRGQELEAKAAISYLDSLPTDITKYMFLRELQDRNERLFYRLLCEHTEHLMPLVYTPVVGEACVNYSRIFQRARGMFITVHDAGQISSILANWPEKEIKAIVVTDGERILGLGDQGANGMGIPVGKLALYTALAGIPPHLTLPVVLDTGTDNQTNLNDPLYIGLKQKRVRGPQYDDLIDEFMEAVIKRWGRSCLIQFEDFGNRNAFRLLEKYQDNYCTFNDDIQGTASVCVAGIIASSKITGMKMSQHKFLFYGAGEAALGTAHLLVMAMEKEGTSTEEARDRIWLIDSRGLCVVDRQGGLDHEKIKFAKKVPESKDLEQIVNMVEPTALIGAAAQPKAFNERILKKMGSMNKNPLIFPLSNPTSKAECTAEEAYQATEGRCVFASGSPFDPVNIGGKIFHPGQGNNAYIFPGVSLAAIACGVHTIPDETFLIAAKALADQIHDADIQEGRVYPPLPDIREVSLVIAAKVAQYFYVESLATVRPEPEDKLLFMKTLQYDYFYD